MEMHLNKHQIFMDEVLVFSKPKQQTLYEMKGILSPREQLERDVLRWIIQDKLLFTIVESAAFKRTFTNLPMSSMLR